MGTTKETDSKFDQRYVNNIEKSLSQIGGVMLNEIAADLALKFGKWNAAMNAACDLDHSTQVKIGERKIVDEDAKKEAVAKARQARQEAEQLRREENGQYLKSVRAYISENYGEERREKIGEPFLL